MRSAYLYLAIVLTGALLARATPCRADNATVAFTCTPATIIVQLHPAAGARIDPADWDRTSQTVLDLLHLGPGFQLVLPPIQQQSGDIDPTHWLLLETPPDSDLAACLATLRTSPWITSAELDSGTSPHPPSPVPKPAPAGRTPNDPAFRLQQHHRQIDTPGAWQITTGSRTIRVAILDSGCSADQPEFSGRMLPGFNFETNSHDTGDTSGHGTAIAGIIGANANNKVLGAGIDWHCRLVPIRVINGGVAALAQGIEWATMQGCRVINVSGRVRVPERSTVLEATIAAALQAGCVVVASSGNSRAPGITYPAHADGVISVGALDNSGMRWQDHDRGEASTCDETVDIVAPGEKIRSVSKSGLLARGSGTSPASAIVAGVCALMLAANPELSPAAVTRILRASADRIGPPDAYTDGHSACYGYGRVNARAAVAMAAAQRGSFPTR